MNLLDHLAMWLRKPTDTFERIRYENRAGFDLKIVRWEFDEKRWAFISYKSFIKDAHKNESLR